MGKFVAQKECVYRQKTYVIHEVLRGLENLPNFADYFTIFAI